MKATEVFTPGKFPTWTFVSDHLEEKEQQLQDVLESGSMLISISGPSKSGKTVFVEQTLGKQALIQVTGAGVRKSEDIWVRVFDIIGTPISTSKTTGSSSSSNISGKIAGEVGIPLLAKGKGEAAIGTARTSSHSDSEVFSTDYLQLLINEIGNTDFIVFIDDFHYIPRDVQGEIAKQIKEAMRKGCKFICASVPYHSDDVIRSNPDLRGRIFSIDFDYWGEDVLKKIAYKGFDKLNISDCTAMVERLASEAAGSPQLMQYLCLNSCFELNVRETSTEPFKFHDDQEILEKICKRTVLSTNYSSVTDKMLEGPKTRGSDRKVYISKDGWQGDVYTFIVKALSLSPPQLTFRYQNLLDRISSLCAKDCPSGSSIIGACLHSSNIVNGAAGDNIVEWDEESDVFDIRDPYFIFYLRWTTLVS
ncbi:ATP-binding protein [Aeromonas bestiarum]|uniref:hypothetical protein n=1 Tax=Aeromonas bestiarum TaxID=105751 RepID=UPI002379B077|nr:hypothetical protein [Aeromonas bestiarum]WDL83157.1 ATP-binding protein [Aeromonas bestiarum]